MSDTYNLQYISISIHVKIVFYSIVNIVDINDRDPDPSWFIIIL